MFFDICNTEMALCCLVEKYKFRPTFLVKYIFCYLQFLNHFIKKKDTQFLATLCYLSVKKYQKIFGKVLFFS